MLRAGQVEAAIGHLQEALRLRPGLALVHYDLGKALSQAGQAEEAIGEYEQALRVKPDYAEAHYNLGEALRVVGRLPDAIAQYEQALRIKPEHAEAHRDLALALERTGRAREAIGHYEQALRIKPDHPEVQNNLAWLLATLALAEGADPARAVTLAERACQLTKNQMPPYLDTLAAAYAATGRFNDAVATAQKAIELANSAGQPQVVRQIEARLQLYRSGQAYRRAVDVASQPRP